MKPPQFLIDLIAVFALLGFALLGFALLGCEETTITNRRDTGGLGDGGNCSFPTGDAMVKEPSGTRPTPTVAPADRVKPTWCNDSRAQWVTAVTGRVAKADGSAVANADVYVCLRYKAQNATEESSTCLNPIQSGSDGWFSAPIMNSNERCVTFLVAKADPAVNNDGPSKYATSFVEPILSQATDSFINIAENMTLFSTDAPTNPPTYSENASNPVFEFSSGIKISFTGTHGILGPESYRRVTAGAVPKNQWPHFATEVSDLMGLLALGPDITVNNEPYALEFPNYTCLPNGTKVKVYVLGGTYTEHRVKNASGVHETCTGPGTCSKGDCRAMNCYYQIKEGAFEPYGTATVSGNKIVLDANSGLPGLTYIGYAPM